MPSSRQDEASASLEGPLTPGFGVPPDEDWRGTRDVTLRKVSPGTSSPKQRTPLSDVRRYLLIATAFVLAGSMLAALDERFQTPHVASAATVLMFGTIICCFIAVHKARNVPDSTARAVAPSMRDAVTGLPNEEYLRLRLRDEFKRMQRYGSTLSLAVFDVNNLASVNEAYGEATGDAVLQHIANLFDMTKRASDVAARLDDDQLALILLECGEDDAVRFLGRLENYVSRKPVTVSVEGQAITLWVGICSGMASARRGDSSAADLLIQARGRLDAARQERDRRRQRWTDCRLTRPFFRSRACLVL